MAPAAVGVVAKKVAAGRVTVPTAAAVGMVVLGVVAAAAAGEVLGAEPPKVP